LWNHFIKNVHKLKLKQVLASKLVLKTTV